MHHNHDTQLAQALRKVTRLAKGYAQRGQYELFPDEVVLRNVLAGMAHNLVQHGRPYCPCREVTGDPAIDRANICPCDSHQEDIARDGHCECRLFVNHQFLRSRGDANTDKEE